MVQFKELWWILRIRNVSERLPETLYCVMFIRTGLQKCKPFPTHSTPLSPNSGKINLIGYRPNASLIFTYSPALSVRVCLLL